MFRPQVLCGRLQGLGWVGGVAFGSMSAYLKRQILTYSPPLLPV